MEGYKANPDHIILTKNKGIISLEKYGYVIGISIEITDDSAAASVKYGLNTEPYIKVNQGDGARGYGGFQSCGVPLFYEGNFQWKFEGSGQGEAILIITTLESKTKKVPGT